MTKNKQKIKSSQLPSAVDDCADVKSKFDRFKKKKSTIDLPQFHMRNHPIFKC